MNDAQNNNHNNHEIDNSINTTKTSHAQSVTGQTQEEVIVITSNNETTVEITSDDSCSFVPETKDDASYERRTLTLTDTHSSFDSQHLPNLKLSTTESL